jgi:hypothetical protein
LVHINVKSITRLNSCGHVLMVVLALECSEHLQLIQALTGHMWLLGK